MFENKHAILFILVQARPEEAAPSRGPFVRGDYAIQPCPHALCKVRIKFSVRE